MKVKNLKKDKTTMRLILLIFLLPLSLVAQNEVYPPYKELLSEVKTLKDSIKQIEILKKEIYELRLNLETQANINEKNFNGISTQLDASSHNLTIFSIFFGIAAILLGIYVNLTEQRIVKISDESKNMLNQATQIKKEVQFLNELMYKDIKGLFEKLKREETEHIFNRLLLVPEDVTNLGRSLLSRKLEQSDFEAIKTAFLKLLRKPIVKEKYAHYYRMILFQHFLDLSLKDEQVISNLIDYFPQTIEDSFENDIVKSTQDFARGIVDIGLPEKRAEIKSFMNGVVLSSHQNSSNVYNALFEGLKTRNNRFRFYEAIENETAKERFGKLILDTYANDEPSKTEASIIEEIESLLDKKDSGE